MFNKVLKRMAVAVAAAAMTVTALPVGASAASYTPGTYTNQTVNLYIPKASNPVKTGEWDAYFTSSLPIPRFAASNNATIVVGDDGTISITLDVDNNGLSLISIDGEMKTSNGKVVTSGLTGRTIDGCDGENKHVVTIISDLGIEITNVTAEETLEYTFSNAYSHAQAKISLLSIDNDSLQTTPAVLSIDMSAAYVE